jgi:hypothetical protein
MPHASSDASVGLFYWHYSFFPFLYHDLAHEAPIFAP